MRMRIVLAAGILAMVVGVGQAAAQERGDILKIANREAEQLGYDLSRMSVAFDEDNSQWQEYQTAHARATQTQEISEQLNGRVYQAVYYSPEKIQLGGDLWVFIDADTGDVIGTIQGQ